MSARRRRRLVVAAIALAPFAAHADTTIHTREKTSMYGLIGKFKVQPGQRDVLADILLKGTRAMPGCLSYVVAADPQDADALWVTEVWDSAASHKASLALPEVKEALQKGRPLIAGFGERFETSPIGGFGLPPLSAR